MEAKQLKSEVDPSEGTSKHRRVKLKPASRTQSHGQLGVVSESHLVKCSRNNQKKKKKEEKKKNVSRLHRLQTVADASEADMAGGSDSHLVKRKRVKRKKFKKQLRDLSGTDGGCNGKQTRATSLS